MTIRCHSVFLALSLSILTGCSTYTANSYGISAENVEIIRSFNGATFQVNQFSAAKPGLSRIQCRGAGPVTLPNKQTFEAYITQAFISELKIAGAYSEVSSTRIDGRIEVLNFNSNIGAGKWRFDVLVSDATGISFPVNSVFKFSTNWVADKACQQVAQAFVPAVQNLIKDIVTNPQFQSLHPEKL